MPEDYTYPDGFVRSQEHPSGPQRAFFQTVAGPSSTEYPDADDDPNVYYAQKLRDVSFPKTVGEQSLSFSTTTYFDYVFNLEPQKYIEEASIVLCFFEYGQWFTIDKVATLAFITTRRLSKSLVVSWNGDYGIDTGFVSNPDSTGLVWVTAASESNNIGREFGLSGQLSGRSFGAGFITGFAIKIDSDDRIVCNAADNSIPGAAMFQLNNALVQQWAINQRYSRFEIIAADVIVAGFAHIGHPILGGYLSLTSAGGEIWRTERSLLAFSVNGGPVDVAIDSEGFVLALGGDTTINSLWKLTSDGTAIEWLVVDPIDSTPNGVAVDSDDNVYVCGSQDTGNFSLVKFDSDGNQIATWDSGGTLYSIAIDSDNNVFVCGDQSTPAGETEQGTLWKLDSDLNLLESFDHGDTLYDVQFGENFVYVTGDRVEQ